ncbi:hypothetical protein IAS59_005757 [Cryptococcus gattii]
MNGIPTELHEECLSLLGFARRQWCIQTSDRLERELSKVGGGQLMEKPSRPLPTNIQILFDYYRICF